MNKQEARIIKDAAGHLLRGLSERTRVQYRNILSRWFRFMLGGGRTLKGYDLEGAREWYRSLVERSGEAAAQNRNNVFPLRCVELAQQMTDAVPDTFAVPHGLWRASGIRYRDEVLSQEGVERLKAVCEREAPDVKSLTRDSLITFVVLLAIRTGMNAESLMGLRRDCLMPQGDGAMLEWFKGRSDGVMRDFYRRTIWGPVEIVERLRELGTDKVHLMVASDSGQRPFRLDSRVLTEWCRRRSVPRFVLADIRPAMATILFRLSNGNVPEVQRFLHHKSPSTTMLYLHENAVRPILDRQIASAVDAIFQQITGGGLV